MNNFSDLPDTQPDIKVRLALRVITHNGSPDTVVTVNRQCLWSGPLHRDQDFDCQIALCEPLDLSVTLKNKIYDQHQETAVIIDSINIDGVEIIPRWTHLASYHNERDYCGATSYLGFNGEWKLQTHRPFYQWLHQITGQGWLVEPA